MLTRNSLCAAETQESEKAKAPDKAAEHEERHSKDIEDAAANVEQHRHVCWAKQGQVTSPADWMMCAGAEKAKHSNFPFPFFPQTSKCHSEVKPESKFDLNAGLESLVP